MADSPSVPGTGSVPKAKSDTVKDANAVKKPVIAAAGGGASTLSSPPPAAQSSNNASGFWPGLLGGLLGGAAMSLLAALYWGGGDDGEAVAQLQSTATELESRLSAAESEIGQVGSLTDRVAAIETAPEAGDGGSTELTDRLTELEQQIGAFRESGSASSSAGEDAINDRLAALEQQLSELSQDVASSSEEQQSVSQTLTTLQSALPTLEATLSATGTTVEEAGQQTAVLRESVDTLRQTTERLSGDLGTLNDRVGGAEAKLDYIGGQYQRAAAMVVAIGDVDRSISKAEPFATTLESLRALGQDDPNVSDSLAALEPMAAEGVPTLMDLKASFGEVGSQVLLAEDGDETLADQVSGNLFGIINMRPAGAELEGDDSRAIVARAQAKLSANDLEGTITELEGLSEAAAKRASDWVSDAKARLAADAAIAKLRAHAQSLLAKGA